MQTRDRLCPCGARSVDLYLRRTILTVRVVTQWLLREVRSLGAHIALYYIFICFIDCIVVCVYVLRAAHGTFSFSNLLSIIFDSSAPYSSAFIAFCSHFEHNIVCDEAVSTRERERKREFTKIES